MDGLACADRGDGTPSAEESARRPLHSAAPLCAYPFCRHAASRAVCAAPTLVSRVPVALRPDGRAAGVDPHLGSALPPRRKKRPLHSKNGIRSVRQRATAPTKNGLRSVRGRATTPRTCRREPRRDAPGRRPTTSGSPQSRRGPTHRRRRHPAPQHPSVSQRRATVPRLPPRLSSTAQRRRKCKTS